MAALLGVRLNDRRPVPICMGGPIARGWNRVILRKANFILILIRQLFYSYSHSHSHSFVMGSARSSYERERAIAWPQDLQRCEEGERSPLLPHLVAW